MLREYFFDVGLLIDDVAFQTNVWQDAAVAIVAQSAWPDTESCSQFAVGHQSLTMKDGLVVVRQAHSVVSWSFPSPSVCL